MKHLFILIGLVAVTSLAAQESPEPAFDFLLQYPSARDFTMSSDGKEAYFTLQNQLEEISVIACVQKKGEKWGEPALVSFTGSDRDIEPFLSADGLKLYFASDRLTDYKYTAGKDFDIWYVQRTNTSSPWSAPVNIGQPINTVNNEFYPSLAENGNLYFTTDRLTSITKDDIFYSKWNGSAYVTPVPLDTAVNTPGYEFNAFIAPDESFIVYTGYNRKDGTGSGDLYINFKSKTGKWGAPHNLGNVINSTYMDYCPFVDLNTNTLYYTSRRSVVSTKSFHDIADFKNEVNKYENGFSRIYKVTMPHF